jgi:hypothetical protein
MLEELQQQINAFFGQVPRDVFEGAADSFEIRLQKRVLK